MFGYCKTDATKNTKGIHELHSFVSWRLVVFTLGKADWTWWILCLRIRLISPSKQRLGTDTWLRSCRWTWDVSIDALFNPRSSIAFWSVLRLDHASEDYSSCNTTNSRGMYEEAFLRVNNCLLICIEHWHLFCYPIASLQIGYLWMFSIFLSPVQTGVSRRDLRMEASQASSRLIISNSGVQSSSNAA